MALSHVKFFYTYTSIKIKKKKASKRWFCGGGQEELCEQIGAVSLQDFGTPTSTVTQSSATWDLCSFIEGLGQTLFVNLIKKARYE